MHHTRYSVNHYDMYILCKSIQVFLQQLVRLVEMKMTICLRLIFEKKKKMMKTRMKRKELPRVEFGGQTWVVL